MKEPEILLAFLLKDKEYFNKIKTKNIEESMFFKRSQRQMFSVIENFIAKYNAPPKRQEFIKFLKHVELGNKYESNLIAEFDTVSKTQTAAITFDFFLDDFKNKYIEEKYIESLQDAAELAQAGLVKKSLEKLQENIFKLNRLKDDEGKLIELKEKIPNLKESFGKMDIQMGVPSGFKNLDNLTDGWKPGDLVLFMADTGGGKSTTLLNMAYNGYLFNKNILFVQMETDDIFLQNRLNALALKTDSKDIRFGRISDAKKKEFKSILNKWELGNNKFYTYNSNYDMTPRMLDGVMEEVSAITDLDLVVVDYIGIMELSSDENMGNIWLDKSTIAKRLKMLARKYHVPLLTAQQVTRDAMKSKNKEKYSLHDISMSIFITHHCDVVISQKLEDPDVLSFSPIAEAVWDIIKNRNNEKGQVDIEIDFSKMLIEEAEFSLD